MNEDDAAELPSVPVRRSAPVAERDGLQPGKPLAAAGAAEADQQLVADELAAAAGENGRSAGETCPVLLTTAGRRAPEAEAVRQHAAKDRGATLARGIGEPQT
jgi:hypothetical protein